MDARSGQQPRHAGSGGGGNHLRVLRELGHVRMGEVSRGERSRRRSCRCMLGVESTCLGCPRLDIIDNVLIQVSQEVTVHQRRAVVRQFSLFSDITQELLAFKAALSLAPFLPPPPARPLARPHSAKVAASALGLPEHRSSRFLELIGPYHGLDTCAFPASNAPQATEGSVDGRSRRYGEDVYGADVFLGAGSSQDCYEAVSRLTSVKLLVVVWKVLHDLCPSRLSADDCAAIILCCVMAVLMADIFEGQAMFHLMEQFLRHAVMRLRRYFWNIRASASLQRRVRPGTRQRMPPDNRVRSPRGPMLYNFLV